MRNFSVLPQEIFASQWRNRSLVFALTKREIVSRYQGSFLGGCWSFFNPLCLPILPNDQYVALADGDLYNNVPQHWLHDALVSTVSFSKIRWGRGSCPVSESQPATDNLMIKTFLLESETTRQVARDGEWVV
jgi:hypothetical protein